MNNRTGMTLGIILAIIGISMPLIDTAYFPWCLLVSCPGGALFGWNLASWLNRRTRL